MPFLHYDTTIMFYPVRKYQHVSFIIPNINQQYYYKLKKYIPLLSFVDKLMPPLSLHLLTPLPPMNHNFTDG